MIELQEISKVYGNDYFQTRVLWDVSLKIEDTVTVAVVGKSGAGKSTLLNILCGLDKPTSGKVLVNGTDLTTLSAKKLSAFRLEHFGFVFQDFQLVSTLNALDNIILPAVAKNKNVDAAWLQNVIEITGLKDKQANYPNQLSGGEQQRVAIARAIINRPSVLFADEPTGNLDAENTNYIMRFLWDYAKKNRCTFVYVTHDRDLCGQADRVLEIADCKVRELTQ